MHKSRRLLLAATVATATMLTSLSADAFWGPFSFMRWGGWGGDGWGWGGPWGGWGGYPGWGGWGYPGYGGWGGWPGYGGWGYPGYGWGAPYAYAPVVAAPAATATSSAK